MIEANIVAALIIVIIIGVTFPELGRGAASSTRLYLILLGETAPMLLANACSLYTLSGNAPLLHAVATGLYYFFYYAVLANFTWYLLFRNEEFAVNGRREQSREKAVPEEEYWLGTVKPLRISDLPTRGTGYAVLLICILSALLWIFAIEEEWFVTVRDGAFQRGMMYGAGQVGGIIVVAVDFLLIWRHRDVLGREGTLIHLTYVAVPVASALHRLFFYEDSILPLAIALSTILIFLTTQINYSRRLREQELQLAEARAAMVMTQIQPHFLYNALNTIYHLCGSAPKKAQTATGLFSDYLRENLDSINRRDPVLFSVELHHIKTYIALEQMRFEERLQVVYDIETDGFLIPPLTVQPIVENAVRHGIARRIEGGTVQIAAREEAEAYIVTVTDDGAGLDAVKAQTGRSAGHTDAHSGIGIANVRYRLREISDGTLSVEAAENGRGVVARITIPKKAGQGTRG